MGPTFGCSLGIVVAGLLSTACDDASKSHGAGTPGSSAQQSSDAPRPIPTADVAAIERARSRSQVKSDEQVVLFPAYAWRTEDGSRWEFELRGWIYEPEENDYLRTKALDELAEQMGTIPVTKLVRQRVSMFLVDHERGKVIEVTVAGRPLKLAPSGEDGVFAGRFLVPEAEASAWAKGGALEVSVIMPSGDERTFSTRLQLVEPKGLTIISDVDDTIKISEVRDKARLLQRTFAMEFEAVPGMAKVYERWLADEDHLHFVSASPWQLFAPLAELVHGSGFPSATFSLKQVRPKDVRGAIDGLLADPLSSKPQAIRAVLDRFPKRHALLVGDSGEKDPEVYGIIARERTSQIDRIYIRDVTGDTAEGERYRRAFDGLARDRWVIFKDTGTLPDAP